MIPKFFIPASYYKLNFCVLLFTQINVNFSWTRWTALPPAQMPCAEQLNKAELTKAKIN